MGRYCSQIHVDSWFATDKKLLGSASHQSELVSFDKNRHEQFCHISDCTFVQSDMEHYCLQIHVDPWFATDKKLFGSASHQSELPKFDNLKYLKWSV